MTGSVSTASLAEPRFELGAFQADVERRLRSWADADVGRRIWKKDPSVWPHATPSDVAARLGWLTLAQEMGEQIDALKGFAEEVKSEGIRHVVLLGMGGSSLAAEVYQRTLGNAFGYPELLVLDSTHPLAVQSVRARIDLARTVFLVSSKSGTTIEPLSLYHFFADELQRQGVPAGRHFVAVTDPGTPLEQLGKDQGFRRVFLARSDVGGRYSALTAFGLVPAALIGADLEGILRHARRMEEACGRSVEAEENPGLRLGAVLGELALAGRDKVTFLAPGTWSAFPSWAEQLIAESTGKQGKGITPVVDEPRLPPKTYSSDRLFVYLRSRQRDDPAYDDHVRDLANFGHPVVQFDLDDPVGLGREFFRWEFAVAAVGAILGIDPFDQPDVELAKELARKAIAEKGISSRSVAGEIAAKSPSTLRPAATRWVGFSRIGGYVAVQAYLCPNPETLGLLEEIRRVLLDRLHVATTLGYGPRYLHSTGQLHKGGPSTGLFLQLVDSPKIDVSVPGADYTFQELIHAQAVGDFEALKQRGRRVLRVQLGTDVAGGLRRILGALRE